MTGALFPTGNIVDRIRARGVAARLTIADASNPVVFVRAEDVGMKGTELPEDLTQDTLRTLELIGSEACAMIGFVKRADEATKAHTCPS